MLNTTMNMDNGELLVTLEGRLDTLTSPGLDKELEAAIVEASSLTIDFEKLEYISSAGFRTILAAAQYMEENELPKIRALHISEAIKKLFLVTGFDDIVDME